MRRFESWSALTGKTPMRCFSPAWIQRPTGCDPTPGLRSSKEKPWLLLHAEGIIAELRALLIVLPFDWLSSNTPATDRLAGTFSVTVAVLFFLSNISLPGFNAVPSQPWPLPGLPGGKL